MDVVKTNWIRRYKAGYELRNEVQRTPGCQDFAMTSAYTPDGDYIGDSRDAYRLVRKRGIAPEKASREHCVCSVGFCEKEQKWYGWSHRAIYGFGVGDVVKDGDCTAESGWTDEYLKDHPDEDKSLPVGFRAESMDDAKRMAVAFAESVS